MRCDDGEAKEKAQERERSANCQPRVKLSSGRGLAAVTAKDEREKERALTHALLLSQVLNVTIRAELAFFFSFQKNYSMCLMFGL